MKKIIFLVLMLFTLFATIACNNETSETTTTLDPNSPKIVVHYFRYGGDYEDWNIWAWQSNPSSEEGNAYYFEDDNTEEEYNFDGVVSIINVNAAFPNITEMGLIVRKGEWAAKDIDADRYIEIPELAAKEEFHIYLVEGDERIGTSIEDPNGPSKEPKLKFAYYKELNLIKLEATEDISTANIAVKADDVIIDITSKDITGNKGTITMSEEINFAKTYVIEVTFSDSVVRSYPITFDGIYDSEEFELAFGYDGNDLGAIVNDTTTSFRLWAPVSQSVTLNLYDMGTPETLGGTDEPTRTIDMVKDVKGTFYYEETGNLHGMYYTYTVNNGGKLTEAVDPYAKSTGVNGLRGMVVDFSQLNPNGFNYDDRADNIINPTDAIIYELHVRDLTSHSSWNGTDSNRGKFLGLVESGTRYEGYKTGFDYIVDLGVTHVQVLPFFDFGNAIDESRLDEEGYNSFNWGYMPLNFNSPEGSYSSDPYDGETRVRELKEMIMEFNEAGIRINMDVVYNHHGETANSNFEQIVPGYYFRKTVTGAFSNGSGTGNETASERYMMRKFMIDSVTFWAYEYNISGFRFDLMALHDVETMNLLAEALHDIDDTIMVYGEPWMGGTSPLVASSQAGKMNLAEMPLVGAFNDDLRDAVKGSVFNREAGGFIQGDFSANFIERIKYGVTGGIAYPGIDGSKLSANKVWHTVPTKTINYVTAHDNNTLHDKLYISLEALEKLSLLPALQRQANAIVLTAQGIPFLHAGDEMLRTKPLVEREGFDHNSYKSPDETNQIRWDSLADEEVRDMVAYYQGLIALRKAYPAFRMTTAQEVIDNVEFLYDDVTGVIAFKINIIGGSTDSSIIVIHNANETDVTLTLPSGGEYRLVVNEETAGVDTISTHSGGSTITVSANSSYVLVK